MIMEPHLQRRWATLPDSRYRVRRTQGTLCQSNDEGCPEFASPSLKQPGPPCLGLPCAGPFPTGLSLPSGLSLRVEDRVENRVPTVRKSRLSHCRMALSAYEPFTTLTGRLRTRLCFAQSAFRNPQCAIPKSPPRRGPIDIGTLGATRPSAGHAPPSPTWRRVTEPFATG